jgi:hypothetical protein
VPFEGWAFRRDRHPPELARVQRVEGALVTRATRRLRRRKVREREEMDAMRRDVEALARDGVRAGMTSDEALALVSHAAGTMARRMVEDGAAKRAPWGLVYDPRALRHTIETALLMLHEGERATDARGDAPDLSEDEARRIAFRLVAGASTLGAAAVLYLASSPIPYALARHLRAIPNPAEIPRRSP